MTPSLFINGIYDSVLQEILDAQATQGGGISYLQPYKGGIIRMLQKNAPSPGEPIRLYISTTTNRNNICYTAEIIGWEDKRELSDHRRSTIAEHLHKLQQNEVNLFQSTEAVGKKAVNIITIRDLRKLDTLYSTSLLIKTSDELPLKKRSRSGGASPVHDIGDLLSLPTQTREQSDSELAADIAASFAMFGSDRASRLAVASKVPERIQIVSTGFRRNADVIVTVLQRALGLCERCGEKAPFMRRSDGTPYLEVHHWIPLSQQGEDTVENAAALCPNCHREVHHA
jgi:5-methylcytosine-specific restriction enzyme A